MFSLSLFSSPFPPLGVVAVASLLVDILDSSPTKSSVDPSDLDVGRRG